MAEESKDITQKPLLGSLVGVGITLVVIFAAAWAFGKGWKQAQKA